MKLKKIHKQRLLKLAKFLREVVASVDENANEFARPIFEMDDWLRRDSNHHQHRRASIKCGTTACAAGWATAVFPELYFSIPHGHIHMAGEKCTNPNETAYYDHVAKFFGLDPPSSGDCTRDISHPIFYLFGTSEQRSALSEATVIEKFVKLNS